VLDNFHLPAEVRGVAHGFELDVSSFEKADARTITFPPGSDFIAEGHRCTSEPLFAING
jgi:hypothetical protein